MIYPPSIQSGDELFTLSCRYFWRSLKQIFVLIVIFVAVKALFTHLPVLPGPIKVIFYWLIAAILVFLWVMSLYRVDSLFRGTPITLRQAAELTVKAILKVYLVCIVIAAAFVAVFTLGHFIIFSWFGLKGVAAGLSTMAFVGIPLILILLYFYLSTALAALYPQPLLHVFYYSAYYSHHRFVLLLVLYVELIVMFVISSTNTRHAQWLLSHHLMEITDLVVFCLFLPLLINLTLLVLHDSRLRVK